MGILNVTPDSFSDGGRFTGVDLALAHALEMLADGAAVIDVGGESTRPGADEVSIDKELSRVLPVIAAIRDAAPDVAISIDTRKSDVAIAALEAGANLVNDVSALSYDEKMADVVAESEVPVVLMHMVGTPKTMQSVYNYYDVVTEIVDALARRVEFAMGAGISESNIILDPGIGFGKSLEHNLAILRDIHPIAALGFPVLVGPSRKRFIGDLTGRDPDERVAGTGAVLSWLAQQKVDYVRVHDVREAADVIAVTESLMGA